MGIEGGPGRGFGASGGALGGVGALRVGALRVTPDEGLRLRSGNPPLVSRNAGRLRGRGALTGGRGTGGRDAGLGRPTGARPTGARLTGARPTGARSGGVGLRLGRLTGTRLGRETGARDTGGRTPLRGCPRMGTPGLAGALG